MRGDHYFWRTMSNDAVPKPANLPQGFFNKGDNYADTGGIEYEPDLILPSSFLLKLYIIMI